jgi:hypothetical protein
MVAIIVAVFLVSTAVRGVVDDAVADCPTGKTEPTPAGLSNPATGVPSVEGLPSWLCAPEVVQPAPLVSVLIPADRVELGGGLKGKALPATVDILFAPRNGQDTRAGAVVEGATLQSIKPGQVVVRVTKDQRAVAIEYLARSDISIVPAST